jgi:hypothetical protein
LSLFPVPYRPEAIRNGTIPNEGRRLRELVAAAHALPTEPIVQLNHARDSEVGGDDGAYFEHMSVPGLPFEPTLPLTTAPNQILLEKDATTGLRDIDFDAMELYNGKRVGNYRELLADWFALLQQGFRPTATANSDTHRLDSIASVPRNYVRVTGDEIATLSPEALIAATRAGRLCGTAGPILDVALASAGPGDTFRGASGTLHIELRVAPWVPVTVLRIYLDGQIEKEIPVTGATMTEVPMRFERDAFIVVEAEGPAEGQYKAVLPGFTPLAFCNPIFVDADADGAWTPPGLPEPQP